MRVLVRMFSVCNVCCHQLSTSTATMVVPSTWLCPNRRSTRRVHHWYHSRYERGPSACAGHGGRVSSVAHSQLPAWCVFQSCGLLLLRMGGGRLLRAAACGRLVAALSHHRLRHPCCADLMKRYVDQLGCEAVNGVVTDNAANMKAARNKLVSMPGYQHIIVFRCIAAA